MSASRVIRWLLALSGAFGICLALVGCGGRGLYTGPLASAGTERPARCACRAPGAIAPNSRAAARLELAPPDATAIALCRYAGYVGRTSGRLLGSRLIHNRKLVSELTRQFNELPVTHGGVVCPFDDGSQVLARFAYPQQAIVSVAVSLRGCQPVTNGNLNRSASGFGTPPKPVPPLVSQLEQLTGVAGPTG